MKSRFYKRLTAGFTAIASVVSICASFSCKTYSTEMSNGQSSLHEEAFCSVTFIDAGEGDSIYVALPNGKNLLIDSGEKDEGNFRKISETIKASGRNDLDYLVLTHADSDHTGGAADIIAEFPVKKAFIPLVLRAELFTAFAAAKTALTECGAETEISSEYKTVKGENFFFTFLSPEPAGMKSSAYVDFNATATPSERERNDISAVIYLEAFGVRFLFTGDAGENAEKRVLSDYAAGVYSLAGREVRLNEIDFLKVAHHGSSDSTTAEFLRVLRPKNAVISVGLNYYGHPSTETLKRISEANEKANILRTDVCGSIRVSVPKSGAYKIFTDIK